MAELSDEIREKVINSLKPIDAAEIRKLIAYSEDLAGGIRNHVALSVNSNATVYR